MVDASVLKKAVPPSAEVCPDLPEICTNTDHAAQPADVLDQRLVQQDDGVLTQVIAGPLGRPAR